MNGTITAVEGAWGATCVFFNYLLRCSIFPTKINTVPPNTKTAITRSKGSIPDRGVEVLDETGASEKRSVSFSSGMAASVAGASIGVSVSSWVAVAATGEPACDVVVLGGVPGDLMAIFCPG